MSRRRAGASKIKGKQGESFAKKFLKANGWLIADSETQGLAGDDIFARDPSGKWWSIEVKNTMSWHPKYIWQAKRQGSERYDSIQKRMCDGEAEYIIALGMDTFDKRDYFVMWHPSENETTSDMVVAVKRRGGDSRYHEFIAPFTGRF